MKKIKNLLKNKNIWYGVLGVILLTPLNVMLASQAFAADGPPVAVGVTSGATNATGIAGNTISPGAAIAAFTNAPRTDLDYLFNQLILPEGVNNAAIRPAFEQACNDAGTGPIIGLGLFGRTDFGITHRPGQGTDASDREALLRMMNDHHNDAGIMTEWEHNGLRQPLPPGVGESIQSQVSQHITQRVSAGATVICIRLNPVNLVPAIEVSKNANASTALPGQIIEWTITVTNNTPIPERGTPIIAPGRSDNMVLPDESAYAMNVSPIDLEDIVSGGEIISISGGGILGACTGPICRLTPLPPGGEHNLTVLTRVDDDVNQICNTATVTGRFISSDFSPASDSDCVTVDLPDIEVIKTVSPEVVRPGDAFTFTIEVNNIGTGPAHQVVLVDTLAPGTSASGATWNLGTMHAGASTTRTISGNALALPPGVCNLSVLNTAVATTPTPEITLENNRDDATLLIEIPEEECIVEPDLQREVHRYIHRNFAIFPSELITNVLVNYAVNPAQPGADQPNNRVRTQYGILSDELAGQALDMGAIRARIIAAVARDGIFMPEGPHSITLSEANMNMLSYGGVIDVEEHTVSRWLRTTRHEYVHRMRTWQDPIFSAPVFNPAEYNSARYRRQVWRGTANAEGRWTRAAISAPAGAINVVGSCPAYSGGTISVPFSQASGASDTSHPGPGSGSPGSCTITWTVHTPAVPGESISAAAARCEGEMGPRPTGAAAGGAWDAARQDCIDNRQPGSAAINTPGSRTVNPTWNWTQHMEGEWRPQTECADVRSNSGRGRHPGVPAGRPSGCWILPNWSTHCEFMPGPNGLTNAERTAASPVGNTNNAEGPNPSSPGLPGPRGCWFMRNGRPGGIDGGVVVNAPASPHAGDWAPRGWSYSGGLSGAVNSVGCAMSTAVNTNNVPTNTQRRDPGMPMFGCWTPGALGITGFNGDNVCALSTSAGNTQANAGGSSIARIGATGTRPAGNVGPDVVEPTITQFRTNGSTGGRTMEGCFRMFNGSDGQAGNEVRTWTNFDNRYRSIGNVANRGPRFGVFPRGSGMPSSVGCGDLGGSAPRGTAGHCLEIHGRNWWGLPWHPNARTVFPVGHSPRPDTTVVPTTPRPHWTGPFESGPVHVTGVGGAEVGLTEMGRLRSGRWGVWNNEFVVTAAQPIITGDLPPEETGFYQIMAVMCNQAGFNNVVEATNNRSDSLRIASGDSTHNGVFRGHNRVEVLTNTFFAGTAVGPHYSRRPSMVDWGRNSYTQSRGRADFMWDTGHPIFYIQDCWDPIVVFDPHPEVQPWWPGPYPPSAQFPDGTPITEESTLRIVGGDGSLQCSNDYLRRPPENRLDSPPSPYFQYDSWHPAREAEGNALLGNPRAERDGSDTAVHGDFERLPGTRFGVTNTEHRLNANDFVFFRNNHLNTLVLDTWYPRVANVPAGLDMLSVTLLPEFQTHVDTLSMVDGDDDDLGAWILQSDGLWQWSLGDAPGAPPAVVEEINFSFARWVLTPDGNWHRDGAAAGLPESSRPRFVNGLGGAWILQENGSWEWVGALLPFGPAPANIADSASRPIPAGATWTLARNPGASSSVGWEWTSPDNLPAIGAPPANVPSPIGYWDLQHDGSWNWVHEGVGSTVLSGRDPRAIVRHWGPGHNIPMRGSLVGQWGLQPNGTWIWSGPHVPPGNPPARISVSNTPRWIDRYGNFWSGYTRASNNANFESHRRLEDRPNQLVNAANALRLNASTQNTGNFPNVNANRFHNTIFAAGMWPTENHTPEIVQVRWEYNQDVRMIWSFDLPAVNLGFNASDRISNGGQFGTAIGSMPNRPRAGGRAVTWDPVTRQRVMTQRSVAHCMGRFGLEDDSIFGTRIPTDRAALGVRNDLLLWRSAPLVGTLRDTDHNFTSDVSILEHSAYSVVVRFIRGIGS